MTLAHSSAADEQNFKDGAHYYRFTADDGHEGPREKERKVSTVQRVEFHVDQVLSCRTLIVSMMVDRGWLVSMMVARTPSWFVCDCSYEREEGPFLSIRCRSWRREEDMEWN